MFAEKAWLIPLLPALSFFVILFFGKKLPKGGAESGILTVGTSFVLAVIVAAQWLKDAKVVDDHLTWWSNGKVHITIGQHVDGLTVMMLAMSAWCWAPSRCSSPPGRPSTSRRSTGWPSITTSPTACSWPAPCCCSSA